VSQSVPLDPTHALPDSQLERAVSGPYRSYVLGVLLLVYVVNFLDRQVLNIVAEPMRLDLGLSDTALGLLGGSAFSVFYTFTGLPIARLADRGSRRSILGISMLLWSLMTALMSNAQGFVHLALARMGFGIGAAGCSPPAHSLLSDYFPRERRATALAIYAAGLPIGIAVGNLLGGWVNELFHWRMVFLVAALPGVLLALMVRLTIRELPRGFSDKQTRADARATALPGAGRPSFGEAFRFMLGLRSFRFLAVAGALQALAGSSAALFFAPFMMRSYQMGTGELGTYLFVVGLAGGVSAAALGGLLTDRLGRGDARFYVWIPALAGVIGAPAAIATYLSSGPMGAMVCEVPRLLAAAIWLGPTLALTQNLAPPRMRAQAAALLLFIVNLLGGGLGPLLTGALSDFLEPRFGTETLRYSLLLLVSFATLTASGLFFASGRSLLVDLSARERA